MAIQSLAKPAREAARRRLRLLDPNFRRNTGKYVLQCAAATISIFMILSVLDGFKQTVLIAALGASSFIAFTMPHVHSARPRYLVGGYLVGSIVGCTVSLLAESAAAAGPPVDHNLTIALAAVATGIAMLLMVATDTEHPPAAGLALGFVLNEWDLLSVAVVLTGIIGIASIKEACKGHMIDLL